MCWEQEGNGGLDHCPQICPEMGNLWGERYTSIKHSFQRKNPSLSLPVYSLFFAVDLNFLTAAMTSHMKSQIRFKEDLKRTEECKLLTLLSLNIKLIILLFLPLLHVSWNADIRDYIPPVNAQFKLISGDFCCILCFCLWMSWLSASMFLPPKASQFNMEHFSGMHNWYACSHARPTFCNVCREALPGVTSHGLSCEGTQTQNLQLHKGHVASSLLIDKQLEYVTVKGRFIAPYHRVRQDP